MELIDLVKTLSGYKEEKLLNIVASVLEHHYGSKNITKTNDFLLAKGNIPIGLVAHVDTVFSLPPTTFFHDAEEDVLWSPQGLGADDRAGIAAILTLVTRGLKPHIILTTKEEKGGIGAQMLIRAYPKFPYGPLKYLIELDRRGSNDCVFYNCENEKFSQYVESFGFVMNIGSFTDISVLCPVWGVAGVNLSVGYREEHSKAEHLYLRDLASTIYKVEKMLKSAKQSKTFKYIAAKFKGFEYFQHCYGCTMEDVDMNPYAWPCEVCHQNTEWEEMVSIRSGKKKSKDVCYHCFSTLNNVELCYDCNEWFFTRPNSNHICEDCEEERKKGNGKNSKRSI